MGFENPVKLMIIITLALLIFGPARLAGIGGALGRAMRDFRNSMREAQDTVSSSFREAQDTFSSIEQSSATPDVPSPHALPGPDPSASSWTPGPSGTAHATEPAKELLATSGANVSTGEDEFEEPYSLASEPTAEALRRSLKGRS